MMRAVTSVKDIIKLLNAVSEEFNYHSEDGSYGDILDPQKVPGYINFPLLFNPYCKDSSSETSSCKCVCQKLQELEQSQEVRDKPVYTACKKFIRTDAEVTKIFTSHVVDLKADESTTVSSETPISFHSSNDDSSNIIKDMKLDQIPVGLDETQSNISNIQILSKFDNLKVKENSNMNGTSLKQTASLPVISVANGKAEINSESLPKNNSSPKKPCLQLGKDPNHELIDTVASNLTVKEKENLQPHTVETSQLDKNTVSSSKSQISITDNGEKHDVCENLAIHNLEVCKITHQTEPKVYEAKNDKIDCEQTNSKNESSILIADSDKQFCDVHTDSESSFAPNLKSCTSTHKRQSEKNESKNDEMDYHLTDSQNESSISVAANNRENIDSHKCSQTFEYPHGTHPEENEARDVEMDCQLTDSRNESSVSIAANVKENNDVHKCSENLEYPHGTHPEENKERDCEMDYQLTDFTFTEKLSYVRINNISVESDFHQQISVKFDNNGISVELPSSEISSKIVLLPSDVKCIVLFDDDPTYFISISSSLGENLKENISLIEEWASDSIKLSFLINNMTDDFMKFLGERFDGKLEMEREPALNKLKESSTDMKSCLIYPFLTDVERIQVTSDDMDLLKPGVHLNDTIIDFYLKYIYYEKIKDEYREKTHIFNCHFHQGLEKAFGERVTDEKTATSKEEPTPEEKELEISKFVNKWTKKVDIFSKNYIFIPRNVTYSKRKNEKTKDGKKPPSHWYLLVICLGDLNQSNLQNVATSETISKRCENRVPVPDTGKSFVFFFDSSRSNNTARRIEKQTVKHMLQKFLEKLWKTKYPDKSYGYSELAIIDAECPQQPNKFDCGLYLLQYVESFFENPIIKFQEPLKLTHERWFKNKRKVTKKRKEILSLIAAKTVEQEQMKKT